MAGSTRNGWQYATVAPSTRPHSQSATSRACLVVTATSSGPASSRPAGCVRHGSLSRTALLPSGLQPRRTCHPEALAFQPRERRHTAGAGRTAFRSVVDPGIPSSRTARPFTAAASRQGAGTTNRRAAASSHPQTADSQSVHEEPRNSKKPVSIGETANPKRAETVRKRLALLETAGSCAVANPP